MRIGAVILSLMLLVGLSLAEGTAGSNVPSVVSYMSSLLPRSNEIRNPGSPAAAEAAGDTLRVDHEAFNNALGLSTGGTFYAAVRLSPAKACTVAAVIFYKWDASYDDYLFVWGKGTNGAPGQLIESVPYSGATTMAWQTVNLPTMVRLTGTSDDIWVGPRINHGAGTYPLGVDDGPVEVTRGGWINSDGRWVELSSVGYNANWHIRAFLGHGGLLPDDIGATLVLAPKDTVAPGPISPMVRIRNFGPNPVNNIPLICRIDSAGSNVFADTAVYSGPLAPSETADVTFPHTWTGVAGKTYQVAIFTKLPEDPVNANDTAHASVSPSTAASVEELAMLRTTLDQVLPTLVHDRVRINFTVARRGIVNLSVYDAEGSLIRTLVNGTLEPGNHSATWDRANSGGGRVANGTYLYRLVADGRTVSSKGVVLR